MKTIILGILFGITVTLVVEEVIVCLIEDYRMTKRWKEEVEESIRKCESDVR